MNPESGPSPEEMGLSDEKENKSEFALGQRVSFVEGETMLGGGDPVTKYGTVDNIEHNTIGVKIEGTGMIVQVAKAELHDASEN